MSTLPDHGACSACGGMTLTAVLDLPDLPYTGRFSDFPPEQLAAGQDQKLLWCSDCGHGQLTAVTPVPDLYDENYAFKTSESATARGGADFFFQTLEEVTGRTSYDTVVDIGCNDVYHLGQLSGRARRRIGVDPIWAGHESEAPEGIEVIGTTVEDAQLDDRLDRAPDIVMATHTFEHISDPYQVLEHLIQIADKDTLFVVEIPGFDALVSQYRFDLIFHDHIQYFTIGSFSRMIDRVGAELVDVRENFHHLGTLIVTFRRKQNDSSSAIPAQGIKYDAESIQARYKSFRENCRSTLTALENVGTPVYGYGAANILPNLAYHMGTDFHFVDAVLDDDPAKDGLHYVNLRPTISLPEHFPNWKEGSVLITALDNFQPIMRKLLNERPRHVVYPLHVI